MQDRRDQFMLFLDIEVSVFGYSIVSRPCAILKPEYNLSFPKESKAEKKSLCLLYNNQINARALIGQSAMVYCANKPMEKSRVF